MLSCAPSRPPPHSPRWTKGWEMPFLHSSPRGRGDTPLFNAERNKHANKPLARGRGGTVSILATNWFLRKSRKRERGAEGRGRMLRRGTLWWRGCPARCGSAAVSPRPERHRVRSGTGGAAPPLSARGAWPGVTSWGVSGACRGGGAAPGGRGMGRGARPDPPGRQPAGSLRHPGSPRHRWERGRLLSAQGGSAPAGSRRGRALLFFLNFIFSFLVFFSVDLVWLFIWFVCWFFLCCSFCFGVFRGRSASRETALLPPSPRPVPAAGTGGRFPAAPWGWRLDSSGPGSLGLSGAISHPPSLGTTLNAALTIRDFRVSVACRDKREPRLENPGVGAHANLVFVCNRILSNFLFRWCSVCGKVDRSTSPCKTRQ